jgi:hypothetical protein
MKESVRMQVQVHEVKATGDRDGSVSGDSHRLEQGLRHLSKDPLVVDSLDTTDEGVRNTQSSSSSRPSRGSSIPDTALRPVGNQVCVTWRYNII